MLRVLGILPCCLMALTGWAEEPATSRPSSWAQPTDMEGVPNLHQVSTELYRSAQPTDQGMKGLDIREDICNEHDVLTFFWNNHNIDEDDFVMLVDGSNKTTNNSWLRRDIQKGDQVGWRKYRFGIKYAEMTYEVKQKPYISNRGTIRKDILYLYPDESHKFIGLPTVCDVLGTMLTWYYTFVERKRLSDIPMWRDRAMHIGSPASKTPCPSNR